MSSFSISNSNNNNDPLPVVSSSNDGPQQPGENDVTLGIGCNKHSGNVKFRQFIKAYKRARFQTNPKIAAAEAVKEVVAFWRNLSPRGRFLAQSKTDGAWHEVEDKQAMRIASFFLMDSGQKTDLKRQKSGQAKKDQMMKQQPPLAATSSSSSAPISSSGNSDLMANLEPVPIGPVSSIHRSSSAGYQQQQKQAPQRTHSHSVASLPTKTAQQPQQRESQQLVPWVDDDFDPLPLKFNEDDLDPLPAASFPMKGNNNSYVGNSTQDIYPNKPQQQQQQYGCNSEQLQVSVNMVVNAMPHRYSIGDNMNGMGASTGLNTVANIQIGTINDPTSMMQNNNNNQFSSSNSDYNYSTGSACSSINNNNCGPTDLFSGSNNGPSSNFQFSTDVAAAGNGFIQISTQSNPNDYNSNNNAMAMNNSAAGMNLNNNMYGMQQQSNNNGNYSSPSQMTMMNSANYQNGSFYGGNAQQQDSFNNVNCNYLSYNDVMNGNNFNSSVGGMGRNQMNAGGMMMMNNNNNLGMNMSSSNTTGMNMNNAMMNNGNNNMNGNNGNSGNQTWNKNKVANSVPCAADLLGNFDDW